RITRSHRRFAEAELVEVITPAPSRVTAPCPYFGHCGGCAWQHLSYDAQLKWKAAIVRESLERLGGLTEPPVLPIVGAPEGEAFGYRNKMDFASSPDAIVGLHRRGAFDRVLDIEACLLPSSAANEVLRAARGFLAAHELSRYDARTRDGFLRHLVLREAATTGEMMVAFVTAPGSFSWANEAVAAILAAAPQTRSILWAQTRSLSDAVQIDAIEVLHGRPYIEERLGGVTYRIGLETFFQTNTAQAERMCALAVDLAAVRPDEVVVDVYCGVGTFALLLAPRAKRVYGIEVVEPSIAAARENAARAGLDNVAFFAGDARRTLPDVLARAGSVDLVVLDPPRGGAGGKVMRRVGRAAPKRILYVSCNPTTLAPDLREVVPFGYDVRVVQPIDLFPQTYHVETLVLLEKVRDADPDAGRRPSRDGGRRLARGLRRGA
ncbi:MAG: 23S rRNA (uracil(1939)-C(5))-methyltransferase RlmD, partial [Armatimonadetes bacterium]|nr:23S rRNA (uracil(1939)-C(5))-methyltransferase RlmD [Armatimonadota bacterium]